MQPDIQHFYHAPTGTLSYVVSDPETRAAAVVDPVLGFSVVSGRTDTSTADEIMRYLDKGKMGLAWILETHAHADHLSAAQYVRKRCGGKVGIGEGIRSVQAAFGKLFQSATADGSQFDRLFADGDSIALGKLTGHVLNTPGHTSDGVTYRFGNAAFVGDTVFMTDFGTARCDFPGGDAGQLFDSIQALFALPDDTVFYLCHDYPPEGRELTFATPISEQRQHNIHVGGDVTREQYIAMRKARDAKLQLPALILPALQVNIQAGHLPLAEDNGIAYVKIPLDAFG